MDNVVLVTQKEELPTKQHVGAFLLTGFVAAAFVWFWSKAPLFFTIWLFVIVDGGTNSFVISQVKRQIGIHYPPIVILITVSAGFMLLRYWTTDLTRLTYFAASLLGLMTAIEFVVVIFLFVDIASLHQVVVDSLIVGGSAAAAGALYRRKVRIPAPPHRSDKQKGATDQAGMPPIPKPPVSRCK